jgi:hypothetical protein
MTVKKILRIKFIKKNEKKKKELNKIFFYCVYINSEADIQGNHDPLFLRECDVFVKNITNILKLKKSWEEELEIPLKITLDT